MAPSRILITSNLANTDETVKIEPGDLLLSVNGHRVRALEELEELLAESPASDLVDLKVLRPKSNEDFNIVISRSTILPVGLFRDIPLAMHVRRVFTGGNAERAGIRVGDLIIAMDGEDFSEEPSLNPIAWLIWKQFLPKLGFDILPTIRADGIMARRAFGEQIRFDVLRGEKRLEVVLTLDRHWSSQVTPIIVQLVLAVFMALGLGLVFSTDHQRGLAIFLLASLSYWLLPIEDLSSGLIALLRNIFLVSGLVLVLTLPLLPDDLLEILDDLLHWPNLVWRIFARALRRAFRLLLVFGISVIALYLAPDINDGFLLLFFSGEKLINFMVGIFLIASVYLVVIAFSRHIRLSPNIRKNRAIAAAAHAGDFDSMVGEMNRQISKGQLGYYAERVHRLVEQLNRDPELKNAQTFKDRFMEEDENSISRDLSVVNWCRDALPILGFIGTVIGIGGALGEISGSIFESGGDWNQAIHGLRAGFASMAFAFDTTLFGLVFFLVLSLENWLARKLLSVHLDFARKFFEDILSYFASTSGTAELMALEAQVGQLQEDWFKLREEVLFVVHEHSPGRPIRDILFQPMVDYKEIRPGLARTRKTVIGEVLETNRWHFLTFGLTSKPGALSGIAVIEDSKARTCQVYRFFPDDPQREFERTPPGETSDQQPGRLVKLKQRPLKILPADDLDQWVTLDEDYRITYYNVVGIELESISRHRRVLDILPIRFKSSAAFVLVQDFAPAQLKFSLRCFGENEEGAVATERGKISTGKGVRSIPCRPVATWCAHSATATVYVFYQVPGSLRWYMQKISFVDGKEKYLELSRALDSQRINLNEGLRQVAAIREDEILLLTEKDRLLYLNIAKGGPQLVVSPGDAMPGVEEGAFWLGIDGSVAIATKPRGRLRFGLLSTNQLEMNNGEGYRIFGVRGLDTFRVSAQGEYLVAIGGRGSGVKQEIVTWPMIELAG